MAWTAGLASGADFGRSQAEVQERYGPDFEAWVQPDYGQRAGRTRTHP